MIKIDEALLARAVDVRIRPLLVDQGHLRGPKDEGYQHHKVIPTARPLLARETVTAESTIKAIQAHHNLLHPKELTYAVDFLKQADPQQSRDHLVQLLYGGEPLLTRLDAFLSWSKLRKATDGKQLGFNATVSSYLLAMSAPEHYAFCKPTAYKPAAAALLGEDQVEFDQTKRLQHCMDFYRAALSLFRDKHRLPFSDLMHCHIAFFIMTEKKPPNWESIRTAGTAGPGLPKGNSMLPLNMILYGPPGTGKTYHAIERAVHICDGRVPENRSDLTQRFKQLREDGRIEMVTFHQSYSYEEFVEGIRPVMQNEQDDDRSDEPGADVRYECRPGLFKRLAGAATLPNVRPSRSVTINLAQQRIWKMSLGNVDNHDDDEIYEDCIEKGRIRLGYGKTMDFSNCKDAAAIERELKGQVAIGKAPTHAQMVHQFKNVMKAGDLVVVSDGNREFRAIGRISSDKYIKLSEPMYAQAREVEWLLKLDKSLPVERILSRRFSRRTMYKLRPNMIKQGALSDCKRAPAP